MSVLQQFQIAMSVVSKCYVLVYFIEPYVKGPKVKSKLTAKSNWMYRESNESEKQALQSVGNIPYKNKALLFNQFYYLNKIYTFTLYLFYRHPLLLI